MPAFLLYSYSKFVIGEVQGADADAEFTLKEFFSDVDNDGIKDAGESTFVRVQVKVVRATSAGDIDTIAFNTGTSNVTITNVVDPKNPFNPNDDVALQYSSLTNPTIGGNSRFDFGLKIGASGGNDVTLNSVVQFDIANITLSQLVGKKFGVRLQSNGGTGGSSSSSRLEGTLPSLNLASSIKGESVWNDLDGDGVQEAGEPGINNVRVWLKDLNGNILATAVTGDNPATPTIESGYYAFLGLEAGTYQIDVDETTLPAGFSTTTTTPNALQPFTLAANTSLDIDIGYRQLGSANLKIVSLGYGAANAVLINPTGGTYFIAPKQNGTFNNTIQITNTGNVASSAGQIVYIRTTNSPFVKIDSVNGQRDGDAGDPIDGIIPYRLSSIGAGSSVVLNTISKIVDGDGTLTEQTLTFSLQDVAGTSDFGAAKGLVSLYLTQTGFNKAAGSSTFSFAPFVNSILQADFDLNWDDQQLSTALLRGAGTLTEGVAGQAQNPEFEHKLLLDSYEGDADAWIRGGGGTYTDRKVTDLQLVWNNPNSIPIANFAANSGPGAFKNGNATPLDSYLELSDAGLFSQAYATNSIPKYPNVKFTAGNISQPAIAGNIVNPTFPNVRIVEYPSNDPMTFEQFVNSLDPAFTYRINITTSSVLPISWSSYSGSKIAAIGLPAGETTLRINNATAQDTLDLSKVEVFAAGQSFPTGVTVDGSLVNIGTNNNDSVIGTPGNDRLIGTNGSDTLNGWLGNDIMTGNNGPDVFVFSQPSGSSTFGNDTITDFNSNDRINLSSFGLRYSDIRQTVNSGSTSSYLLIELPSNRSTGTIRLNGITSALSQNSFVGLV